VSVHQNDMDVSSTSFVKPLAVSTLPSSQPLDCSMPFFFFFFLSVFVLLNWFAFREAVKCGKCVVIGLQSTGEARTLEQLERDDGELSDFVSTAK